MQELSDLDAGFLVVWLTFVMPHNTRMCEMIIKTYYDPPRLQAESTILTNNMSCVDIFTL